MIQKKFFLKVKVNRIIILLKIIPEDHLNYLLLIITILIIIVVVNSRNHIRKIMNYLLWVERVWGLCRRRRGRKKWHSFLIFRMLFWSSREIKYRFICFLIIILWLLSWVLREKSMKLKRNFCAIQLIGLIVLIRRNNLIRILKLVRKKA